jgi:hypothetical protein
MEYRAGEEQGFRRIWGHVRLEYSETFGGLARSERGFLTPGDAALWLANFVDSRNGGGTVDGRLDVYLRPPGLPGAPPEVAVDIEVPEASGTAEKGRSQIERLLWRYTRAPSVHLRFWYTEQDPKSGRDRRIAEPRPLAHILLEDTFPDQPRPTVAVAREIDRETQHLQRLGHAQCGALAGPGDGGTVGGAVYRSLRAAQDSIRDGRMDLCAACFAPR